MKKLTLNEMIALAKKIENWSSPHRLSYASEMIEGKTESMIIQIKRDSVYLEWYYTISVHGQDGFIFGDRLEKGDILKNLYEKILNNEDKKEQRGHEQELSRARKLIYGRKK